MRGLVLPIGGVKEKVLGALRAGISTVMLPARNRKDLKGVPEKTRAAVRFVWLETVDDAMAPPMGQGHDVGHGTESPAPWSERHAALPH